MLINKNELQPLQMLLRIIVANVNFLRNNEPELIGAMPAEGIKMAACVITIGPIVFLYPFVQKYFIKGIMVGAVKG
jgi:putative aldouronate transport system permease protein